MFKTGKNKKRKTGDNPTNTKFKSSPTNSETETEQKTTSMKRFAGALDPRRE